MPRFKSLAAALGLLVVTAAASADINIGVIVSLTHRITGCSRRTIDCGNK